MDGYTLGSVILTVAVLVAYLNHRYIGMQSTIAIMTASLGLSIILLVLKHLGFTSLPQDTTSIIASTHFQTILLKGMLSFLLFAGALTIDFNTLRHQKWEIGILASLSTVASALLVGVLTYYLLLLLGLKLSWLMCLLFGALISPTDPIAVLATFKEIGAAKKLSVCVGGESLFNDGVGIVIFTTFYQLAFQHAEISFAHVAFLFLKQAIGGLAYGLFLGVITCYLIKSCNDAKLAVLLTLASVSGGYTLALWLTISGPLAMVVAGIYIGNKLRHQATAALSKLLEVVWEVIDELLNAMLFLLIGFELLLIDADSYSLMAALLAIPLVLIVRLLTVAIPMKLLQFRREHGPYTVSILTWGGLRGGLAVALALSLPASHGRDIILTMTYAIVAFAIIVQGLSIKPLARLSKPA